MHQQPIDVGRMQAGGGLVQHVQRSAAPLRALQLGGQLDALGLAAAQLRGRLAQAQVAQADGLQQPQRPQHGRLVVKGLAGSVHRQVQHVGDGQAAPPHLQRGRAVARAVARRARRVHAGHEQQLHAHAALAFTDLAAALGHVERELPRVIAALARLRRGGEQLAHRVEQAGVRGQIGARRAAYGLLVDGHQAVHVLSARGDVPGRARLAHVAASLRRVRGIALLLLVAACGQRVAQMVRHQLQQRLADQAGLARPGHTRHRIHAAQRERGVQPVQVVAHDAFQAQPVLRRARCAQVGHGRGRLGQQVAPRDRALHLRQPRGRAAVEHLPALLAGARAHVHQPVGAAHGGHVVLHHEQRVACRLQPLQRRQQRLAVGRVQAGGGFVQHIDHAEQVRGQLPGQAQALQLAGRQRGCAARK